MSRKQRSIATRDGGEERLINYVQTCAMSIYDNMAKDEHREEPKAKGTFAGANAKQEHTTPNPLNR